MPRKPPPEPVDRADLTRASLSLTPDLDAVLGMVDFEEDEIKTGVLAAVLDTKDIPGVLQLLSLAIAKSEELKMTCYVVRSGSKIYATNVKPENTRDLNAMYLIEVLPPRRRDELTERLFTALRAMVGRITR